MVLSKLFDIVAPYSCICCDKEGSLLCNWCTLDAFLVVPDRCFHCFKVSQDSATCKPCYKLAHLSHVWVATTYEKHAKVLILKMKSRSHRSAAKHIARQLDETAPYFNDATVTYAPTSPARVRERGFDHSKYIAVEFARLRGLPCRSLLARSGNIKQIGSTRAQRLKQVQGSYRSSAPIEKGTHIVLIDDVLTTGATLSEAAKVLKKAGAKQVDGLVFAQTV